MCSGGWWRENRKIPLFFVKASVLSLAAKAQLIACTNVA
jgi:hypothetical protein